MDNQLVFDLLSKTIRAAELLRLDQPFADTLRTLRERLAPAGIGQNRGQAAPAGVVVRV